MPTDINQNKGIEMYLGRISFFYCQKFRQSLGAMALIAFGASAGAGPKISAPPHEPNCVEFLSDVTKSPPIEVVEYYGKTYFVPKLSHSRGVVLHAKTQYDKSLHDSNPTLLLNGTTFDVSAFAEPTAPVTIGLVKDIQTFSQKVNFGVLDMLIKPPGVDEYRLPAEVAYLAPVVQEIIDFEHSVVPPEVFESQYAYLTLDQRTVAAGTAQRPGIHVDGFQELREFNRPREMGRTYLVADVLPTLFYVQPWNFSALNSMRPRPTKERYFAEMARQAQRLGPTVFQAKPYEIVASNSYHVHESPILPLRTVRTIVRLSFEPKRFDRYGNTVNPLFDYDALRWRWRMRGKPE